MFVHLRRTFQEEITLSVLSGLSPFYLANAAVAKN